MDIIEFSYAFDITVATLVGREGEHQQAAHYGSCIAVNVNTLTVATTTSTEHAL
jgi:hypothetical protein